MLGVSRLDSSFSTTSIPFLRASATTLFAFPKSIPTTLILRFDRSRSVFASTFRARKRRALSRGSRARFSARRVASRVEASTCAKRRVGSIVEPSRRRALPGVFVVRHWWVFRWAAGTRPTRRETRGAQTSARGAGRRRMWDWDDDSTANVALALTWLALVTCSALVAARRDVEAARGAAARGKDGKGLKRGRAPHAWFRHFYVVGCAANARELARLWARGAATGRADARAAVVAATLFQAHCLRRFYESARVSTYGDDATMHAIVYAGGLAYYLCAPKTWAAYDCGDAAKTTLEPLETLAATALGALGVALFALGNYRQYECHVILARLREPSAPSSSARDADADVARRSRYFIPRGGWFERVSCAHYLAEIVLYLGLALIVVPTDVFLGKLSVSARPSVSSVSRASSSSAVVAARVPRLAPLALLAAVVANLACVASSHHAWYLKTFGDAYPRDRGALFPRRRG